VIVTLKSDDEALDPYEQWARTWLEQLLGPLQVIDRESGPPGMHDFEGALPGGSVAALEVTSQVASDRLSVESEIKQRGLSSFQVPGLASLWAVRLTDDARVKDISRHRGKLRQILSDLEVDGVQSIANIPPMRALGIASAFRLSTRRAGVVISTDAYAGFAWQGPVIDTWLADFLASPQGVNKLEKLRRARASERHLVIVLDSFSQPGLGIPLGLSSRRDAGGSEYVMPSFILPEPLTHLWLLPMVLDWEGLHWTRGRGWAILSAFHPASA
jgi:hypothetical protein